jgi:hypothetical protein
VHEAAISLPGEDGAESRPDFGKGCGDIVVEVIDEALITTRHEFFLRTRVALSLPGRVYELDAAGSHVMRYRALERCRQTPNGTVVRCSSDATTLEHPIPAGGPRLEHGNWRWRWWPLRAEGTAAENWEYGPIKHTDDYVLKWRPAPVTRPSKPRGARPAH